MTPLNTFGLELPATLKKGRPRVVDPSGKLGRPSCYLVGPEHAENEAAIGEQLERFNEAKTEYFNLARRVKL